MLNFIKKIVVDSTEKGLGEEHCGIIKKNKNYSVQIFVITQFCEKFIDVEKLTFLVFMTMSGW